MRCPDCNKFVSFDTDNDPEVDSVDYQSGEVTASVRIVNVCAECGTEMKEATLELSEDVSDVVDEHVRACHELNAEGEDISGHEITADEGSAERTMRTEGSGRYTKTFYGVTLDVTLTCDCGKWTHDVQLSDDVQASSMDECC